MYTSCMATCTRHLWLHVWNVWVMYNYMYTWCMATRTCHVWLHVQRHYGYMYVMYDYMYGSRIATCMRDVWVIQLHLHVIYGYMYTSCIDTCMGHVQHVQNVGDRIWKHFSLCVYAFGKHQVEVLSMERLTAYTILFLSLNFSESPLLRFNKLPKTQNLVWIFLK